MDERELLRQLTDALDAAGQKACWSGRYGYSPCDNGCCSSEQAVHNRALIARARALIGVDYSEEPVNNQLNCAPVAKWPRG